MVRAALMGGLALFAPSVGRRQDGLNSLAFVAGAMALFNPQIIWNAGFQLSFNATLGLILYAQPLSEAFVRLASRRLAPEAARRLAGPAGEYFLFTLAAQLLSLPVSMFHFQRFSLTALIANPVVLPIQPPVMVLGGLAVAVGMVYLPAGRLVGAMAWPFMAYTIRVVELLAKISGGSLATGSIGLLAVLLFYVLLLGWTFAFPHLKKAAGMAGPSVALLVLGSLAVMFWRSAFSAPDGRLHLTVLNVGSGDGIQIQTPSGRNLLVDGEGSPSLLSNGLGRRLPLDHRKLDFLVVAAGNEEQVGALPGVLERFPAQQALWAGPTQGTYAARELLAIAFDKAGTETGRFSLVSSGEMLQLMVKPEKIEFIASGEDLAYLNIELTDDTGILEAGADRRIHVKVEGAGVLQGLASANARTEEVFDKAVHDTFFGRAQAIIRGGTEIGLVKVLSAEGLDSKEIILRNHL